MNDQANTFYEVNVPIQSVENTPAATIEYGDYRTGKYAENPIVLYEYKDNRRQENPAEFLKGFKGYLQTDGYTGYNMVENVVRVGCLAHLRRKFTDAEKASPIGKVSPTVTTALSYCNKLFAIEKELSDLPYQERFELIEAKAEPVIAEFSYWAKTRMASQKSKLGIALTYLNNQLPVIQNYLLDGRDWNAVIILLNGV